MTRLPTSYRISLRRAGIGKLAISRNRLRVAAFAATALSFLSITTLPTAAMHRQKHASHPAPKPSWSVIHRGSPGRSEIALTFDDGPNPPYTDAILSVLEREQVHATFFVVGAAAQRHPNELIRMNHDGDAVENHSWAHEYTVLELPHALHRSLEKTADVIRSVIGTPVAYFRPPYGVRDQIVVGTAKSLGERTVLWSVPLSTDWKQPGVELIVARSLKKLEPGAIIVLHDGDEGRQCAGSNPLPCNRSQEIEATLRIIERVQANGYRFVTIPELVTDRDADREANHT